jgi:hypothetical protein
LRPISGQLEMLLLDRQAQGRELLQIVAQPSRPLLDRGNRGLQKQRASHPFHRRTPAHQHGLGGLHGDALQRRQGVIEIAMLGLELRGLGLVSVLQILQDGLDSGQL